MEEGDGSEGERRTRGRRIGSEGVKGGGGCESLHKHILFSRTLSRALNGLDKFLMTTSNVRESFI